VGRGIFSPLGRKGAARTAPVNNFAGVRQNSSILKLRLVFLEWCN
jgi:hypothetical protein